MHIAIAFDNNYLTPFYALIASIFSNNLSKSIVFHCIINDNVSIDEKKKIQTYILKHNSVVNFYSVDEEMLSKFVLGGTWTSSVYYKMFFPLLIKQPLKKLLYLDTDMIVVGDLEPLFNIDLESYALAAVYDNYVKTQPEIGIVEEGKYFNSGMLLYNIPLWNEQMLSQKAIEYLNEFPQNIKFVDQCALNAILKDNWYKVHEKYNLIYSYIPENISQKELNEFIKDVVVVHFTLQRPWNLLCRNRLRKLYFRYLKESNYNNAKRIWDFEFIKLPRLIKLRIIEFYFDNRWIQYLWRKIK
ncbi:MAG: hypothetical protein RLZZ175_2706 [Bacteroidota bacterium]|jgi:lipopolysaccharide biosynthesis glycosyltransferase